MIFLDIDVPRYVTSDIQENKTPSLKKTIRGNGVLEKSDDFGFENDIILRFEVNENILKKMIKIYARFKTMTMIPVFDSNLKNKFFSSYSEFFKTTIANFAKNMDQKEIKDVVVNSKKATTEILNETVFFNDEIRKKFNIEPKVKDCVMCFLKSFAYKTTEETSDGYEVEMVLYPCEDLTFYLDNESKFLQHYYKLFAHEKLDKFKAIDKIIDEIFETKLENNNITFLNENLFNQQETYSKDKTFTKEAEIEDLKIENKYIAGVEVRNINNLKRIPIVGKAKGFIQNLGQGEIGITLRLVYNQKNVIEEKIVSRFRSIAHFNQENIVSTASKFYLFDCLGIKETSISNIIISEPTPDVDVTIINVFLIGSFTSKIEDESNYYMNIERGSSNITAKIFSNFLDIGLQLKNESDLKEFSNIIITKSNKKTEEEDIEIQGEEEYIKKITDHSFKLQNLFDSYNFKDYHYSLRFPERYRNAETSGKKDSQYAFDRVIDEDVGGIKDFVVGVAGGARELRDTVAYDEIANRIYKYAFLFLSNYKNTDQELFIRRIIDDEKRTEVEFFEKVYRYYLAESFSVDVLRGAVGINNIVIGTIFKIEIMNNYISIFKNLLDSNSGITELIKNVKDFDLINNNGKLGSPNKMNFLINGKFNSVLIEVVKQGILSVYSTMEKVINNSVFIEKAMDFYKLNYAKDVTGFDFSKIRTSLEEERDNLLRKLNEIKKNITNDSDVYLNTVLIIFKSITLFSRTYGEFEYNKNKISDDVNQMTLVDESALLTAIVFSLYIPNFNFEKTLFGKIAFNSAKELISPLAISISSLSNLNLKDNIHKSTDEQVEFIQKIKKIIELYLGKEATNELLLLQTSYVTPAHKGKDYQKFLNVEVFDGFDTPLEFFQQVLNSSGMLVTTENYIKKTEEIMKNCLKNYNLEKLYNNVVGTKDKDEADQNKNDLSKELEEFGEAFVQTSYVFDETINKQHVGTTIPATIASSEIVNFYKTFRTIKDIFSITVAQYKYMIPDYEVLLIDEQFISDAYKMGYDIDNKMFSIRNVTSININKNDKTNLKTAIVKIANTRPQFIDMDYSLKEKSLFESIDNKEISLYSTKFKTDKIIFRSGLLINISLDVKNDFFDFTGKIDSVEITSSEIILICSSFASELLSCKFDVDNTAHGQGFSILLDTKRKLTSFITNSKEALKDIANSKSYYINQNIIPGDFINGKIDTEHLDYNISASLPCIVTGICKAGETIKHLSMPYNDLLSGTDFTGALDETKGYLVNNIFNWRHKDSKDQTSNRILENINAVEYDATFYGFKNNKMDWADIFTGYMQLFQVGTTINPFNLIEYAKDLSRNEIIPVTSSYINSRKMFEDLDQRSHSGIDGYTFAYQRQGISLYDILNDMTLRNPATFWDVIESGNYATVFFGRSNYMFTRKNKNVSISKTEIMNLIFILEKLLFNTSLELKKIDTVDITFSKQNNISFNSFLEFFLVMRNLPIIFDNNLGNDEITERKIRSTLNMEKDFSNSLVSDIDRFSKDYTGEYPITNKLLAISGYNLVSSTVKTMENFHNIISLNYNGTLNDRVKKWIVLESSNKFLLKLFDGIPESREKIKQIDNAFTTNICTVEQASEFAQSVFYNDLKEYYSGKIVTLYQPDIRKNSELTIVDSLNKFYGTVIVRDFQHILSTEVGMITIITPGLKVTTSSLISDMMIVDYLSEFKYEYFKFFRKNDKLLDSTSKKIESILDEFFKVSTSVPIVLENVEYKVDFNKEKTKEQDDNKNNNAKKVPEKNYKEPQKIKTLKAESRLPYKIYPLVRNGKIMMPDGDIYGRLEESHYFNNLYSLKKILSNLCYNFRLMITSADALYNFKENMKFLTTYLFPGKNTYLYDIINSFFPSMSFADFNTREEFIKRILNDDYNDLLYSNNNYGIRISEELLSKDNICFFNVKQLSATDYSKYKDDKIVTVGKLEKIAKIIFHFKIVNLVEVNRYFDGTISDEIVNLLIDELNKLSSNIKGTRCKSWKLISCHSAQNYDNYDDTTLVLLNSTENSITNVELFDVEATEKDFDNRQISKTIKVLKYTVNLIKSKENNLRDFDVYVFHNYYGADFENEALNIKLRKSLLDNLIKIANQKSNRIVILGDFNLNLIDVFDNYGAMETTNNRIYIIDNTFKMLLKNQLTTQGGQQYDNIIVSNSIYNEIRDIFYSNKFKYNNSPTYDEEVSDHFPIFLNQSTNEKIIK